MLLDYITCFFKLFLLTLSVVLSYRKQDLESHEPSGNEDSGDMSEEEEEEEVDLTNSLHFVVNEGNNCICSLY